jgi:hypothetical protein
VSEGATGTPPRAEASFHPVAGGGVLFDAAQGRLYALNPAAGMAWLCMRDGLSRHQSTLTLAKAFEVDRRIAAEWVHISIGIGTGEVDEPPCGRVRAARSHLTGPH